MNLIAATVRRHRNTPLARRLVRSRPTLETLEALELLTVIPLTGQYVDKGFVARAYTGLTDFATYDTTTATFNIDVNNGAPNQSKIQVQLGNPTHDNIPIAGVYTFKQGVYSGLDDFAIFDATTDTFYVAPNNGNPSVGRFSVQVGDRTHDVIPLVGNYSAYKSASYINLDDFATYDATTGTFNIDVNNGDPYHNKIQVQVGDPTHNNVPLVGRYSWQKYGSYTSLDDFATYDTTTATFNIDINNGDPYDYKIGIQVGDPSHQIIPLAGMYSAYKSATYSSLFDFATYDATTSTFNVDVNNGDPYHNKIQVQVGDPTHTNVPLVGQYSPFKYPPYNQLVDFATYDVTTATYNVDVNNGDPYHNKIRVQIGDPAHNNIPVVSQYSSYKAPVYQGMDDFAAYDPVTATFNIDINNGDPYHNKMAIQLGDPTHR